MCLKQKSITESVPDTAPGLDTFVTSAADLIKKQFMSRVHTLSKKIYNLLCWEIRKLECQTLTAL
jgi:hypothetical protein